MRWLDCTHSVVWLFPAADEKWGHFFALHRARGVCVREIFRLTAKQEEKRGSYKLLRFLCSQSSPFPLLCSSGQPDLVHWTSDDWKSYSFTWNLSYTVLPGRVGCETRDFLICGKDTMMQVPSHTLNLHWKCSLSYIYLNYSLVFIEEQVLHVIAGASVHSQSEGEAADCIVQCTLCNPLNLLFHLQTPKPEY